MYHTYNSTTPILYTLTSDMGKYIRIYIHNTYVYGGSIYTNGIIIEIGTVFIVGHTRGRVRHSSVNGTFIEEYFII